MGWTSYHATHYDKRGNIDRRAECDENMNGTNSEGTKWEVLKSAMHGSTYYAAVRRTMLDGESRVFGAVCLTSVNSKDYYNFAYKDMSEDMLPYFYDCPLSIISLLSPTENESALEWRKLCRENAGSKNKLSELPVGAVIEYEWSGKTERAVKMPPAYQFKTPWWNVVGTNHYIKKKDIPKDCRVVAAE